MQSYRRRQAHFHRPLVSPTPVVEVFPAIHSDTSTVLKVDGGGVSLVALGGFALNRLSDNDQVGGTCQLSKIPISLLPHAV